MVCWRTVSGEDGVAVRTRIRNECAVEGAQAVSLQVAVFVLVRGRVLLQVTVPEEMIYPRFQKGRVDRDVFVMRHVTILGGDHESRHLMWLFVGWHLRNDMELAIGAVYVREKCAEETRVLLLVVVKNMEGRNVQWFQIMVLDVQVQLSKTAALVQIVNTEVVHRYALFLVQTTFFVKLAQYVLLEPVLAWWLSGDNIFDLLSICVCVFVRSS